jgi:hypothetical protein
MEIAQLSMSPYVHLHVTDIRNNNDYKEAANLKK